MIGRRFYFACWQNFELNLSKIATSIPFSILERKFWVENLEAYSWSSRIIRRWKEDNYFKDLKLKYYYLLHKHQLEKSSYNPFSFLNRPIIPTIRLSQLANLYCINQNLFSQISESTLWRLYIFFKFQRLAIGHYQFDKESTKKKKAIEVICRFDYYKYCGANSICIC
jgi:hypothetical protein